MQDQTRIPRRAMFAMKAVLASCTVVGLAFLFASAFSTVAFGDDVELRVAPVSIRHVDYQFAVKQEESGLRRFDWKAFRKRPRKIVSNVYEGVLLENDALKATLIPSKGRIHSLVNKSTGNELLWINPCALQLGANNDTGFWM